jgi:hypothetical protein
MDLDQSSSSFSSLDENYEGGEKKLVRLGDTKGKSAADMNSDAQMKMITEEI